MLAAQFGSEHRAQRCIAGNVRYDQPGCRFCLATHVTFYVQLEVFCTISQSMISLSHVALQLNVMMRKSSGLMDQTRILNSQRSSPVLNQRPYVNFVTTKVTWLTHLAVFLHVKSSWNVDDIKWRRNAQNAWPDMQNVKVACYLYTVPRCHR